MGGEGNTNYQIPNDNVLGGIWLFACGLSLMTCADIVQDLILSVVSLLNYTMVCGTYVCCMSVITLLSKPIFTTLASALEIWVFACGLSLMTCANIVHDLILPLVSLLKYTMVCGMYVCCMSVITPLSRPTFTTLASALEI